MALLKNPNELQATTKFAGLIYGQPGVGKSTLSLSGPNTVMIDADGGMKRVEKKFQVTSLQMNSYRELLELISGNELEPFETITIDTLGKLVDKIGDYLAEDNPKNRKSDGALTMQGYGALKVEFGRLVRLIKTKNKNLIFVAHEKEEKDGDTKIVRPDVSGSSGKDLVKDLDFMGYMEMRGNKRTISFTPTEKYYAKNSLKLDPVIDVPEPKGASDNTFITKHIIEKAIERMKADDEENKKYETLVASVMPLIAAVSDAKDADECLATIGMAAVIWDSQRVMKAALNERIKAVGLVYDREAKVFRAATPKDAKEELEKNASLAGPSPQEQPATPSTPESTTPADAQKALKEDAPPAEKKSSRKKAA